MGIIIHIQAKPYQNCVRYVSSEDLQNLISSLTNCSRLQKLELIFQTSGLSKNCDQNSKSLQGLGKVLGQLNKISNLTLKMDSQSLDQNLMSLSLCIENFVNLTELNLICYNLYFDGEYHFLPFCSLLQNCKYLQTLNLGLYGISGKITLLEQVILKCPNIKNLILDLSYSSSFEGITQLCLSLSKQTQISAFTLKLEDVSESDICNFNINALFSDLSKWSSLRYLALNFSNNKVQDQDFSNLGSAITNCTTLELDLSSTDFDEENMIQLKNALENNCLLLTLSLKFKNVNSLGFSILATTLESIPHLSNLTLDVRCNDISPLGVFNLCSNLSKCNKLFFIMLNLKYFIEEEEDYKKILARIHKLKRLAQLEVIYQE
ncbi:hypothetical protein ABPG74_000742 [Tetrahymena malaccensis]